MRCEVSTFDADEGRGDCGRGGALVFAWVLVASLVALAMGGCTQYQRDTRSMTLVDQGQFGRARDAALSGATRSPSDRSYMLDRVKVMSLALADGVPEAAEPIADRLYDFLRSQGVNAEKDFATFFAGEGGTRVWKGEPFEQAMALAYIGMVDASRGSWGNLRAAAGNALFQLRDLSRAVAASRSAARLSGDSRAAEREQAIAGAQAAGGSGSDGFDRLVTAAPSDFELGYLLKMIAARRLGTGEEAELETQLLSIAPRLSGLAQQIRTSDYNLVMVVDYGLAPQKYATGPDGAIAAFRPVVQSSAAPLLVATGGARSEYPVATDLNRLAQDLKWNNLEDMRRAKSAIGTGLLLGGSAVAIGSDNRDAKLVGLGMVLAGALLKSSSAADTRHVEVFPQRSYVALVSLQGPDNSVELSVAGDPGSRLVLAGVPAPPEGEVLFRYVRLAPNQGAWAASGRVLYASDAAPAAIAPQDNYPWILGGRCVRTPSEEVLSEYQENGFLRGMNVSELVELYRDEGIHVAGFARREEGEIGRHVLEGGNWLYSPQVGTSGFARLYGAEHQRYVPRSKRAIELSEQISRGKGGGPAS